MTILRRISWLSGPATEARIWEAVDKANLGATKFGLFSDLRALVDAGHVECDGSDAYGITPAGRRLLASARSSGAKSAEQPVAVAVVEEPVAVAVVEEPVAVAVVEEPVAVVVHAAPLPDVERRRRPRRSSRPPASLAQEVALTPDTVVKSRRRRAVAVDPVVVVDVAPPERLPELRIPALRTVEELAPVVEDIVVEELAPVVEEPVAVVEEPVAVVEEPVAVVEEPVAVTVSETETPERPATVSELDSLLNALQPEIRAAAIAFLSKLARSKNPVLTSDLRLACTGANLDTAVWRNARDAVVRHGWAASAGAAKWTRWRLTQKGRAIWIAHVNGSERVTPEVLARLFNAADWWRCLPIEAPLAEAILRVIRPGPVRGCDVAKRVGISISTLHKFRAYASPTDVIALGFGRWSQWSLGPNAPDVLRERGMEAPPVFGGLAVAVAELAPDRRSNDAEVIALLARAEGALQAVGALWSLTSCASNPPQIAAAVASLKDQIDAARRDVHDARALVQREVSSPPTPE